MVSLDMTPRLAYLDQPNRSGRHAEGSTNPAVRFPLGKTGSDFRNITRTKDRVSDFFAPYLATLSYFIHHVIGMSTNKQVLESNASRSIALVAYDPIGRGTRNYLPSCSMGHNVFTMPGNNSVSISIGTSKPDEASARNVFDVSVESFNEWPMSHVILQYPSAYAFGLWSQV